MALRRSERRDISSYKKGDYVEFQYKGSTVTGKLVKKSTAGSDAKPIWVISPSDRRRKNEEIPEGALGKIINAQEAMTNRAPKLKKTNAVARGSSPSSTHGNSSSDRSLDEGKIYPSNDDNFKPGRITKGKRKTDESHSSSGSEKANKVQKTVHFSQESNATTTSKITKIKQKRAKVTSTRIGTRSTIGATEAVLVEDLPVKRKAIKGKTARKDDNVTVVKMLTGTLYLFRGDRPRAEFVRSK